MREVDGDTLIKDLITIGSCLFIGLDAWEAFEGGKFIKQELLKRIVDFVIKIYWNAIQFFFN